MTNGQSGSTSFNPVPWAVAVVILTVFGSVSYRVATSCEPSTFDLLQQFKVDLGGCTVASVKPAKEPAPPPVKPPSKPTTPPQIISQLPTAQKRVVQKGSKSISQAAQALPLIVKDDFSNNDYGWPVDSRIHDGGIECNTAIEQSAYHITVHSAKGPAYCFAGITKTAKDFILSAVLQLTKNRNTDVQVSYRLSDDKNYYYLMYHPQTQILSAGVTVDGESSTIIGSVYVEEINKVGMNKITLLALGSSHVIYFNEKLIALFTDDRLGQGQFRFTVRIQEANQEQSLLLDKFDLRGS